MSLTILEFQFLYRFCKHLIVFFSVSEYCGTFCYPNVAQSPYLRTVGEKLLPGIDVLWTGNVVFSLNQIKIESWVNLVILYNVLVYWLNFIKLQISIYYKHILRCLFFNCTSGPKVVSKDIPVESIEEVSKIIRRAPVIWDNIHANDYDQKRLFLGPYKGRSTELIPRLKGVLTNPNCEFEANFVAIHTLATWYKSNMNGVRKDVVMSKLIRVRQSSSTTL